MATFVHAACDGAEMPYEQARKRRPRIQSNSESTMMGIQTPNRFTLGNSSEGDLVDPLTRIEFTCLSR
ncbi:MULTISPECIES: hypothetical protein [Bradyrhizobium]|uniref:Uncharacterized protein n=2 Tax=Nitrobacteraceae TaxID=41294 RepID=A0A9X1UCF7_9BRAD|nr:MULTISPECIES: hypothetical protein [Bradyrhizobium]MCG2633120.1 hypothetical protein [Bradyrhizobium zhengyangense]MCG2645688.1 hypothetical protein [Bradyrhizobium zhengyangense]MCG2673309.1 hypothetical protein [Bradyrhizobium zhengyangense]MDN4985465.1 hypothetical protein [Bradyrhizobium sp. WYCCWR 13022]MDN5006230.1 hypothetical protein [Bradyrhizobium sp. WYCCWR 12677]